MLRFTTETRTNHKQLSTSQRGVVNGTPPVQFRSNQTSQSGLDHKINLTVMLQNLSQSNNFKLVEVESSGQEETGNVDDKGLNIDLVNEEINVPVSENIIVNTVSDVNACKCLTDIDEVQDQESNIGVCLKNQAETTKSIGLVSAKPETEKPVSEADNIKDTDKDEDNMLFMAVDESDITELFESSEMQQILGSEITKTTVTAGRQRRQSEDPVSELCSNLVFLIEPSQSYMEKSPLIMAASIVDMMKNVTGKMRILNYLRTDVTVYQGTFIGTAVIYDSPIYQALSVEDEDEVDNFKVVRRVPFDRGKDITVATEKQNTTGTVELEVTIKTPTQRPEPKPNINKGKASAATVVRPHFNDIYMKAKEGRSEPEIKKIASNLDEFKDVFSTDDDDLGTTNIMEHSINTGSSKPLKQSPRRVPLALADEETLTIEQMERQGIVRKSLSPWASPIVLVRKKNGKVRPCIDYRRLNSVTENDAFPIPRIQDCLDAVSGSTIFTTVHMTSGYHQVPVKESDIPKTAFVTKYGLYEFTKMPMGLKSAPMTFQRVMKLALQGLQWQSCLIYLDDVVIFSKTFDEHIERLSTVLDRIRTAGLKLKPEKCQFFSV